MIDTRSGVPGCATLSPSRRQAAKRNYERTRASSCRRLSALKLIAQGSSNMPARPFIEVHVQCWCVLIRPGADEIALGIDHLGAIAGERRVHRPHRRDAATSSINWPCGWVSPASFAVIINIRNQVRMRCFRRGYKPPRRGTSIKPRSAGAVHQGRATRERVGHPRLAAGSRACGVMLFRRRAHAPPGCRGGQEVGVRGLMVRRRQVEHGDIRALAGNRAKTNLTVGANARAPPSVAISSAASV